MLGDRLHDLRDDNHGGCSTRTVVQALPSTGCTAFGSTSLPVEAAIKAADQSAKADDEIRQALCREARGSVHRINILGYTRQGFGLRA